MTELTKLLDGSVDDVKTGLKSLSHDDLLRLKTAEADGKDRKGVTEALEDALAAADSKRAGGVVDMGGNDPHHPPAIAADIDTSGPANLQPADDIDTSGAPQQIVDDVDMTHPAVDADPRAGTSATQNRIDFNDPVKSGQQVVEETLAKRNA